MQKMNSTPEQNEAVLKYMTSIGFNTHISRVQNYIDMCCEIDFDSMGMLNPIDIYMIRSIVNYPISKALIKNCKMSPEKLKSAYNNILVEAALEVE